VCFKTLYFVIINCETGSLHFSGNLILKYLVLLVSYRKTSTYVAKSTFNLKFGFSKILKLI
jgi:hypothetical protein